MNDSKKTLLSGGKYILSLLLWILFALPVAATDVDSLEDLKEFLKGELYINRGTDALHTELPVESASLIATGEKVYGKHCAVCHGAALQGQEDWNTRAESGLLPAPPHDASGHTWHHADDQLFEIVKYGPAVALGDPGYRSAMPAFGDTLGDNTILAVLVYIRSTWPEDLRQWQAGINDSQSGR